MALRASSTASVVMVAPEMASTSPSASGSVLSTNWSWNRGSRAFAPRPSVSANWLSPILMDLMVRPSRVTCTATGPPKPCAEVVQTVPSLVTSPTEAMGASVASGSSVTSAAAGASVASGSPDSSRP